MDTKNTLILFAGIALVASPAISQEMTFASSGGAYQEAVRQVWLNPAAESLGGVAVSEDTYSDAMSQLRAQVSTGAVTWDLVELGSYDCVVAANEGLLEPIDYSLIDASDYPEAVRAEYWLGSIYYSNVIAWNTNTYGENGPQSWADVWDVEAFPGTRALWRFPMEMMEAALRADGVASEDLYPIDIDRAIASLERIAPHVSVWWESGAQAAQLLRDGEADIVALWNGRVSSVISDGGAVDFTFNDAIMNFACFAIPRGAPNRETAMAMLAHIALPESQAQLPTVIEYAPANPAAFSVGIVSEEDAAKLSSAPGNIEGQHIFNAEWWAANVGAAGDAFDLMLLQQ
jgi:putative spermidine/putrescine transport system substrate-binding protein